MAERYQGLKRKAEKTGQN